MAGDSTQAKEATMVDLIPPLSDEQYNYIRLQILREERDKIPLIEMTPPTGELGESGIQNKNVSHKRKRGEASPQKYNLEEDILAGLNSSDDESETGDILPDWNFSLGEQLPPKITEILLQTSNEEWNEKIVKKFQNSKLFTNIESNLLEAFDKDDDLDSSGPPGANTIYSTSTDNKLKEVNQHFLNALKPLIAMFKNTEADSLEQKKLEKIILLASAMIYKASLALNKVRLSLILRQNFPKLCKASKIDTLVKRLSKDVQFETNKIGTLTGDAFAKKIKNIKKVDQATKEFALESPNSPQPGPSNTGRYFHNQRPQFKFNQTQQGQQFPNANNSQMSSGENYEKLFTKIFQGLKLNWSEFPIGGRVTRALEAWQRISDNEWLLSQIKGASLNFKDLNQLLNQKIILPELKLSTEQNELIQKEIDSLLEKSAIIEVQKEELHVICPLFTVAKKDGGHRPVHNLKALNSHLCHQHFKLEGLPSLFNLLQPNDYFVKIDLKDAYLSISMKTVHTKFLGFSWKGKFYRWTSLPFGLSQAPWIFTKILKPVAAFFRMLAIFLFISFNDMLLFHKNKKVLEQQVDFVGKVLSVLGFEVNFKKSIIIPCQRIPFLGFIIDSTKMMIFVPPEKLGKFKDTIKGFLEKGQTSVHDLSKIVGQMNSFCTAILPGHLHFRNIEKFIHDTLFENNQNYNFKTKLSSLVRKDLEWWFQWANNFNGKPCRIPETKVKIFSDSSLFRWGAISQGKMVSVLWSSSDNRHINIKELEAALRAFQSFIKIPFHSVSTVELFTDNYCTVHAINAFGSSRNSAINTLATQLWHEAIQLNAFIRAVFIPGKLNMEADWASRFFSDNSDWQLNKQIFQMLNSRFGPFTIDLFANYLNHQLPVYFSWMPDPNSEAIDALSQTWPKTGCYAFPPFILIPQVLQRVQISQSTLLLIAPYWPQQNWFPMLLQMLVDLPISLGHETSLLTNPREFVHPLLLSNSLHLHAWPISGQILKQKQFRTQQNCLSQIPLEHLHGNLTSNVGQDGRVGVINGNWIHATPLSYK
jgi:hypothetical protein